MKNQKVLVLFLLFLALFVGYYTILAVQKDGWNLLPFFWESITSLGWNGQFNVDFLCYLWLSGLWVMWRDHFSPRAICWGIISAILGIVFFAPYCVWIVYQSNGNLNQFFLGNRGCNEK